MQCFIAEQTMVGLAAGAGAIGAVPWVATFAAFLSRAYDQIRMAALSSSISKSAARTRASASAKTAQTKWVWKTWRCSAPCMDRRWCILRTLTQRLRSSMRCRRCMAWRICERRAARPCAVQPDGKIPDWRQQDAAAERSDVCVVVAAGITLHEAIKAADQLQSEGIAIRVVDAYSVKPIDADGLRSGTGRQNRVIVVEDHWIEGGLGDAVLEVFAESGSVGCASWPSVNCRTRASPRNCSICTVCRRARLRKRCGRSASERRDQCGAAALSEYVALEGVPLAPQLASPQLVRPLGDGLINETFLVELAAPAGPVRAVLQRVNPLFGIAVHDDIEAITTHLAHKGIADATPSADAARRARCRSGKRRCLAAAFLRGGTFFSQMTRSLRCQPENWSRAFIPRSRIWTTAFTLSAAVRTTLPNTCETCARP